MMQSYHVYTVPGHFSVGVHDAESPDEAIRKARECLGNDLPEFESFAAMTVLDWSARPFEQGPHVNQLSKHQMYREVLRKADTFAAAARTAGFTKEDFMTWAQESWDDFKG